MLANQKEVTSWFSMVSQNEITLIVINDPNNFYHGISTVNTYESDISNLTLFNLNQICYSEFNYTLFYQKLGIRSIKVITFVITHCALKSLCHHTKRAWFMPLLRMFHFWFALTSHTYKLLNNFRLNMRKKKSILKKVGGCIMQNMLLCVQELYNVSNI